MNSGRLDCGSAQVSSFGKLILFTGELLIAAYTCRRAGRGSLLPAEVTSFEKTVPLIVLLEVVDGPVAHGDVEPAGMPAVDVREGSLDVRLRP